MEGFKHELHPVYGVFRGVCHLFLREDFFENRDDLHEINGLVSLHLHYCLQKDIVGLDAFLADVLLLVGHQQQDGLEDLIEPFPDYPLEVVLGVDACGFLEDLLPEEVEDELQPL